MARREKRIKTVLTLLKNAGYNPMFVASDSPDMEDDTIILSDGVEVQVDALSGDVVAVTRREGADGVRFWDVDDDEHLLLTIKKALKQKVK